MTTKVSVIIPVYNAEDYLGQCLDSILTQTLEDIEVICVDDGSTDESPSTLQTYAFLDSRLKVITQENKGAAAARNRGMKEATGEYVIFLDADDFFEDNMLEKMVAKAEEDGSDVVVCGHYLFDNRIKEKTSDYKIPKEFLKKSPFNPEDFKRNLFDICEPSAWNKLVRRELIEKNDISFDERVSYVEDQLFACCVLTDARKISAMEDCFVYYRTNIPTQATSFRSKRFLDALKTMAFLYARMKEKYGETYLQTTVDKIRGLLRHILAACSGEEKRKGLMAVRKELSEEILERLFPGIPSFMPKVSIIIPVYNSADFLPKCLDSCLNQTLKEIEVICVDDGSTDNSLEILNQYAEKDKRIIVMHQENQRQAIARNKAMEVASGKFIQFVDSDDWLELDASECLYLYSSLFDLEMCQLSEFQSGKGVPDGEAVGSTLSWLPKKFKPVFNKKDIIEIFPYLVVAPWATFYLRSFLTRNNIRWINKKIAYEDTPFFVESILKAKRVGALDVSFYHRYNHSDSTEHQVGNNLNEYVEIVKYTLARIEKWANKDTIARYCARYLKTVLSVFKGFENTDKAKMAPYFYDLCFFIQKKYYFSLDPRTYKWCVLYLKDKSKKEKLRFYFYRFLSLCVRNNYTLNLFSYQKKPFSIKILNLPVLGVKVVEQAPTLEDVKYQISRQNVCIKVFGLTVFKIKRVICD